MVNILGCHLPSFGIKSKYLLIGCRLVVVDPSINLLLIHHCSLVKDPTNVWHVDFVGFDHNWWLIWFNIHEGYYEHFTNSIKSQHASIDTKVNYVSRVILSFIINIYNHMSPHALHPMVDGTRNGNLGWCFQEH